MAIKSRSLRYLLIAIALSTVFAAQTAAQTVPHTIQTFEQLAQIGKPGSSYRLSDSYVLVANIDASMSRVMNDRQGFEPIGTYANPFTGTFDGQGYSITGLYINRPQLGHVGLFGHIDRGAWVRNLGVLADVVSGSFAVGALAGGNDGTITNCYSAGSVRAGRTESNVGGLVGVNGGTVNRSYSVASVFGQENVGGLAGLLVSVTQGAINDSYAGGMVSGVSKVGGLAGYVFGGQITNSYAFGWINGVSRTGGLIGADYGSDAASHRSIGTVSARNSAGGSIQAAAVTNSFWDINTTGQSASAGGVGKNSEAMKRRDTYTGWSLDGGVWTLSGNVNAGYPSISGLPAIWVIYVSSLDDLARIGKEPGFPIDGYYMQTGDIDASASRTMNGVEGFEPIGYANGFTGTYDGGGYRISGIYINRKTDITTPIGFFGGVGGNGVVRRVHLELDTIVGIGTVGGLAGTNEGVIVSSSVSRGGVTSAGVVTLPGGMDSPGIVGGLVSVNYGGVIVDSRIANGVVSISGDGTMLGAGGLVGWSSGDGIIAWCYSTAVVNSDTEGAFAVGGLIGLNEGMIADSYATGRASGAHRNIIGGLVGWNFGAHSASITRSRSAATVISVGSSFIGGLAGWNIGRVSDSYFEGSVFVGDPDGNNDEETAHGVGGLVGVNDVNGIIERSYSTGPVSSGGFGIGGLVGVNMGRITASYSTGAVFGIVAVGGLVGSNSYDVESGSVGIIERSFSMSTVQSSGGRRVGGLVGVNGGNISETYSTGLVINVAGESAEETGGLIGAVYYGSVTSSYWNTTTSGLNISAGGSGAMGRTTVQMRLQNTYVGWNFATHWAIDHNVNSGYPYLRGNVGDHLRKQAEQASFHTATNAAVVAPPRINVRGKTISIAAASDMSLQVRVIDLKGRTVYRTNVSVSGNNSARLQLNSVSAGRYLVEIRDSARLVGRSSVMLR
ncbi:MAG: DUF3244 domain-containing protein [Chitinispirillales bacterium]|jgi:hypothetical protein|nr:DUF3244 domain-containing protein [Chitinispirillales bacterium]